VLLIIGVVASLSYNPSLTAPASNQPSWHTVNTYSGSGAGSKKTGTFGIRSSQFRIIWNETSCPYPTVAGGLGCGFSIGVYPGNGQSAVDSVTPPITSSPQSGVEYVNKGPGNFYIFVLSFGPGWSINIEDYY